MYGSNQAIVSTSITLQDVEYLLECYSEYRQTKVWCSIQYTITIPVDFLDFGTLAW